MDSLNLRESWLRDIVDLKEKENGWNQDVIYKSLMTQENKHIAGRRLCRAMGKFQAGLTHVEVNTTTSKEKITKKKDVEDACHDENRRKLSPTSNTPLMHRQIAQ